MLYREIDCVNTVVSEQDYPQVAQILESTAWHPMPTKISSGVFIWPKMSEPRTDIQALRDIAPYMLAGISVTRKDAHPISQIILEQDEYPRTWLHLVYDGQSVQEIITPAHQWDVNR